MNKYFLILGFVVLSVVASASDFLNDQQRKQVLQKIDSTCADTWCEGDYNYDFKSIRCDVEAKACSVYFDMIEDDGEKAVMSIVSQSKTFLSEISTGHSVACTVKNVSTAKDVYTIIRPDYSELTDKFYASLSDCIETLEKRLRR